MATPATRSKGPLDGVCVLDLTSVMMGPYCTQILADLGSDVIKIESPDGDTSRGIPPSKASGDSSPFRSLNRGKRGVVIDLQKPAGKEVLMKLAERADVIVHSMRPKAIEKLGIDYKKLSKSNPLIIYCSLLGFGRGGRYEGTAAYDDIIQAVSGYVMLQKEMLGTPQYMPTVLADKVTGLTAAYAILAALLHRERHGQGQEIDVPMYETMASFILVEHLGGGGFNPPIGRPMYPRVTSPSRKPFKTIDGYLAVMVYNDKQWRKFAELTERHDLVTDVRFATLNARSQNITDWNEVVAGEIEKKTCQEWMEILGPAGVPAMKLNRIDDLFSDEHLADVGFFKEIDDPIDGKLCFPGFPIKFSETPGGFDRAGPTLGEHTNEVLLGAGYTAEEIQILSNSGAIRRA